MNLDVNAQQLLASLLQSSRRKAWNNGYEPALERSNPSCSPIMLHAKLRQHGAMAGGR